MDRFNSTAEMLMDNSSSNQSSIVDRFSKPLQIFAATASITIMLVGLVGNLLTIIALCKYPKVRNIAAAFIISLCVADFVFCLVVLPFDSLRFINPSWTEIKFLCVLIPFLRYGNVGVSLLLVAAITINRYIMIAHHSIYNKVYKKHWIALMILFCCLFSYGMQIPILLEKWGKFGFDEQQGSCSIVKDDNGRTAKEFLFVSGFIIPCVVIIACYTTIFWVVHRSESRMRKHASPSVKSPHVPGKDPREKKQRRSEWRITKMVLVIFLSFVICYLPLTIVKVHDKDVLYPGFHVMGYLLLYFASCVNPIIYVIMNKQYRQAYAGVISCSRIIATLTPHASSAPPGQNNIGQDYSKTMVSTVSIAMNSVKNAHYDEEL